MKINLLVLFFSIHSFILFGQQELNIQVLDAKSGEPLIGVTIYNDSQEYTNLSDENGSFLIPKDLDGKENINFSYVGYTPLTISFYDLKQKNIVELVSNNTTDTIVIVGRRDDKKEDIPYQVSTVSNKTIEKLESQTTADALEKEGTAYIQRSQLGGGSINIRGFEANKVLMVVDGVRLNNAIYRGGHLQNAITIDPSSLDAIEVIYGPGSLVYGSEALGGVVHFRTKEPKLVPLNSKKEYLSQFNYGLRTSTASREQMLSFDFGYSKGNWGSMTAFSIKDYDDLKSGSKRPEEFPNFGEQNFVSDRDPLLGIDVVVETNPDIQQGSGYGQLDFLQKFKYRFNKNRFLTANFQFSSSSDLPRYDSAQDTTISVNNLKYSEFFYGPQKRILGSIKYVDLTKSSFYDRITAILAYQKIDEDRFQRRFANSRRESNKEDVHVMSASVDMDKRFDEKKLLQYGVDFQHNIVFSTAAKVNIFDNTSDLNILTRYPNNQATYSTGGAFANFRWVDLVPKITFDGGLRYSVASLTASYLPNNIVDWPQVYIDGVTSTNSNLTWSTALAYKSDNWKIQLLSGTAFRSPNIDDFAKIRFRNGKLVVPNIELQPEKTWSSELNVQHSYGNRGGDGWYVQGNLSAHYTQVKNLITRVDSNIIGELEVFAEGERAEIQTNINSDEGTIYGGGAELLLQKGKWTLKSNISQSFGTTKFVNNVIDTLVPLSHIPPLFGRTSLSYAYKKWDASFSVRYNGAKKVENYAVSDIELEEDGTFTIDREGTSDNFELTPSIINEKGNATFAGSYAWTTLNFYTSFQFSEKLKLSLSVENITDIHYRGFASGISAPGRNFILSLRGTL